MWYSPKNSYLIQDLHTFNLQLQDSFWYESAPNVSTSCKILI